MKNPDKQIAIENIKRICEENNIAFDPNKLVFTEADTYKDVNLNSYRLLVIKENNVLKVDRFFSEEQIRKWLMLSIGEEPSGLIGDRGEERVGCIFVEKEIDNICLYVPFSGNY